MTEGTTGDIAWWDVGNRAGPTVVMVHSLGLDHTMWEEQVGLLAPQMRVITVDLPGHGRSTSGPGEYRVDAIGHDLLAVAGAAGLVEFDLVGISIGGLTALWLAINAGDRVARLVLANTSARLGSRDLWSQRIAKVEEAGMEGITEMVISRFFAPETVEQRPDVVATAAQILVSADPAGYRACCAALRDADLTSEMGAISSPTLVIGGGLDTATPVSQQEELVSTIPGARLEVIAEAAHISNLDRPLEFNALLAGFLLAT